jgi:hypothetical protein
MRVKAQALLASIALFAAVPASAQDAEPEAPPEQAVEAAPAGETEPAGETPTADEAAQEAQPEQADRVAQPAQRPPPPPIMVVVLTTGRLDAAIEEAIAQSFVARITDMAGGRPVHALAAAEIEAAITACRDDACIGAILAQAGAQAGLIVRLRARGRRPIEVALELRDPVSGTQRMSAAIEGTIPFDIAQAPAAIATLTAQLEPAMPSPPPPPSTLLITVNVDGAQVRLDGQELGASPLAPVEVLDGAHTVIVMMPGYGIQQRRVNVQPGEQARMDVTLSTIAEGQRNGGGGDNEAPWMANNEEGGGDVTNEWWFWLAIGGGAAILIGVAIGIGVAVATGGEPQPPPMPSGIMLPPIIGGN